MEREGEEKEMRNLAQEELWGKNGDVRRGFLRHNFAKWCMKSILLSVSPWLLIKSTSHRMCYITKSVGRKVPERGDYLE